MHSSHLRKDDLTVLLVIGPTVPFCMPFYWFPLEVRVNEFQGKESRNIILLSFVVCFATILPSLMNEPSKSHLVHSPLFSFTFQRDRLIQIHLFPNNVLTSVGRIKFF